MDPRYHGHAIECLQHGHGVDTYTWELCCVWGSLDELEKCIMLGADVNAPTTQGRGGEMPLCLLSDWAEESWFCHAEEAVAKTSLLLRHGASVNIEHKVLRTPILTRIKAVSNSALRRVYVGAGILFE